MWRSGYPLDLLAALHLEGERKGVPRDSSPVARPCLAASSLWASRGPAVVALLLVMRKKAQPPPRVSLDPWAQLVQAPHHQHPQQRGLAVAAAAVHCYFPVGQLASGLALLDHLHWQKPSTFRCKQRQIKIACVYLLAGHAMSNPSITHLQAFTHTKQHRLCNWSTNLDTNTFSVSLLASATQRPRCLHQTDQECCAVVVFIAFLFTSETRNSASQLNGLQSS